MGLSFWSSFLCRLMISCIQVSRSASGLFRSSVGMSMGMGQWRVVPSWMISDLGMKVIS